ncbi:MAG: hypothetical protein Hyperionvirus19_3 [Hyperionvirus sp.]|uniref:MYM-type domain-containing protein n=1 Tax=Hyperionvirus sp. TaxID=2487770 RepID=A0A3G5AFM2_9VIRU|nr:MAG: hypothetical protein Hyperionvirus19_3 [Hyperionvirus sp.]
MDNQSDIDGITGPRKRGRPRKNKIIDKPMKLVEQKKRMVKETDSREIILHIPLFGGSKIKKSSSSVSMEESENVEEGGGGGKDDSGGNAFVSETNDAAGDEAILTISDQDSEPSDQDTYHVEQLLNENKKLQRLIKQLKSENLVLKNAVSEAAVSASREISVVPMNISFIDCRSGKMVVCERTEVCCWWDTCKFESFPVFIPERYYGGNFYVFGCFCSFDCAAAYNLKLNDYKVADRYSLIKKLHFMIKGVNEEIPIAPPREILDKFGGYKTIEEYRGIARTLGKEYKLLLPPMINQLACIEEKTKESDGRKGMGVTNFGQQFGGKVGGGNNMLPVKKKSLYNSNNLDIIDTIGIKEK